MKKLIASPKWFITYLILVLCLFGFLSMGIVLLVYSVKANSIDALACGILTLVYMLPITGIIIFYLNRRACWIWVEDGCFQWKGLLWGFKGSIAPEEVADIASLKKRIYIFVKSSNRRMHCGKGIFELSNNCANRALLESFLNCKIYLPKLCDTCKNLDIGKFKTPKQYLATLSHLKGLLADGQYEMISSDYPIDAVQDENGCWVDDMIYHYARCKVCGADIYCFCDTYHGNGRLTVVKK